MMAESRAKPKAKRSSTAKPKRSGTAKPKVKNASGESKPRKSLIKSKSTPKAGEKAGVSASRLIDQRLGDWREETLARMRALILEADPGMIEERKWRKPSN